MDPTYVASFDDAGAAERAFVSLLDQGVLPEDLSLIVNEYSGSPAGAGDYDLPAVNSLEGFAPGEGGVEEEGSFVHESQVGGGISTSSPDDAADSIDQLDDGQAVAEEQLYPESGVSFSSQEEHDVKEAATTGFFNTTAPDQRSLGGNPSTPAPTLELTSLNVAGLGRVVGDGVLATLAVGAANARAHGAEPPADLADYLLDAGVPQEMVADLDATFRSGGGILAVAVRPGDITATEVESILERTGVNDYVICNDVPEPNG
jgi:hypothetical protein